VVETALTVLGSGVLSFLLTILVRNIALSRGLMDVPNARSSHVHPTPRGGGLAIVAVSIAALAVLFALHRVPSGIFITLSIGGGAVALVGFLDDKFSIAVGPRILVHFAAATWAMLWLSGLPISGASEAQILPGVWGFLAGVLGIVWSLNLYNFMDGIDGLAASEATFVAWGGALLLLTSGSITAVPAASLVFGAASCGFLCLNWPPARIFLGDVGSGFIGYTVAVIALGATREIPQALIALPLLSGVFLVDATVTLLRRLMRGERPWAAHRSHAYQQLSRRWDSHKKVTLTVVVLNLVWLLPWGYVAMLHPRAALAAGFAALLPLVIIAIAVGAGAPERA
jgi:Fuc2NAc and GlcNAc transferase